MSYTQPVAQVQIAVGETGNPQIQVFEFAGAMLPPFPAVAVPSDTFPDAFAAQGYATALLREAGLISREAAEAGLVWVSSGYTVVNGQRMAVRRAPLMGPEWKPLAGTRN